jgi:bacterioferritin-associated ferredoxin
MDNATSVAIKARFKTVCICKGISQGKIQDAIKQGCCSIEDLKKKVGCATGNCNAVRCGPAIEELLKAGK